MDILLAAFIGYFLGSIPTAFIILKKNNGLDIRKEGSGNVGTLNSYEVTNSKLVGLAVLSIDVLKGALSVVIVLYLFDYTFTLPMLSLLFAVFGHCYSIWLKFNGGRGIATAFGGALLLSPLVILIWFAYWKIIHKTKKDIHLANILASIFVIFTSFIFSQSLNKLSFVPADTSFIFAFSVSLLMMIILSKHIQPLKEIINKK